MNCLTLYKICKHIILNVSLTIYINYITPYIHLYIVSSRFTLANFINQFNHTMHTSKLGHLLYTLAHGIIQYIHNHIVSSSTYTSTLYHPVYKLVYFNTKYIHVQQYFVSSSTYATKLYYPVYRPAHHQGHTLANCITP